MRTIIFIGVLFLTTTTSQAVEVIYKDSEGNVLKDICGLKRNPDLSSIYTHIPYTQEECVEIERKKEERKRKQHWMNNISGPLSAKMHKQLNDGYQNFIKHLQIKQKEVRKKMGVGVTHKINREIYQDHYYYKAYMKNESYAFSYFVKYENGKKGVSDYIKWFNSHGFNLDEWRKICSKTPLESSKNQFCEKEDKQGSYLIDTGHIGGPVYIYFYDYTPKNFIKHNKKQKI